MINPGLRPGLRLAVISTTRPRMPILDAEGRPLQVRSTAYVVGVVPGQLKNATATADGSRPGHRHRADRDARLDPRGAERARSSNW